MTDSRVTPQAVEAAANAVYEREYRPLMLGVPSEWQANHCRNLAITALTAAVPLLCQPLQDEIDRLRDALSLVRGKMGRGFTGDLLGQLVPLTDIIDEALAAVPVGTGGAE